MPEEARPTVSQTVYGLSLSEARSQRADGYFLFA